MHVEICGNGLAKTHRRFSRAISPLIRTQTFVETLLANHGELKTLKPQDRVIFGAYGIQIQIRSPGEFAYNDRTATRRAQAVVDELTGYLNPKKVKIRSPQKRAGVRFQNSDDRCGHRMYIANFRGVEIDVAY